MRGPINPNQSRQNAQPTQTVSIHLVCVCPIPLTPPLQVPHPTDPTRAASAGEDNLLLLWDVHNHTVVKRATITDEAPVAARKIQRAATSSKSGTNQCARAITFSPDGKHLAVGTNQGKVAVYDAATLAVLAVVDLNPFGKANNANPEHWIQAAAYSPDGKVLAVGTHGSVICLLNPAAGYGVAEKLTAHNAPMTALDWSTDSAYLQSVDVAYELLFHAVVPGLKGSKQEARASKMKNVTWSSQTCKFGWAVDGLFRFNQGQEGFAIMATDRAHALPLQATGETDKAVHLWRAPCTKEGNAFTVYKGHASHVTNVRFSNDDAHLFSCGGNDKCIFQWAVEK